MGNMNIMMIYTSIFFFKNTINFPKSKQYVQLSLGHLLDIFFKDK